MFADLAGTTFAMGANDEVTELDISLPGVVTGFAIGDDDELYVLTLSRGIGKLVPA